MAHYITLTKHPERLCGELGLSMYFGSGGPTPPPPPRIAKVHLQTSHPDSAWTETFEDNRIPAGYYSGRTDLFYVRTESGITLSDSCFNGCTNLKTVVINGSSTIAARSFTECRALTSVHINTNGTQVIGDAAFTDCDTLTSITLPSSLTNIGDGAFEGCDNLSEIICKAMTAPQLGDAVFTDIATYGNLFVPMGATGYDAWLEDVSISEWYLVEYQDNANCIIDVLYGDEYDKMKSLLYNFANGIIPDGAFSGRTDVSHLYSGDGDEWIKNNNITEIGESTFEDCTNFESASFIDGVLTTIGDNAFKGCENLMDIQLPETMETIGDGAFSGCTNLSFFECRAMTAPTLGTDAFAGIETTDGELHIIQGASGYDAWLSLLPEDWQIVENEPEEENDEEPEP